MRKLETIFGELLKLVPRYQFEKAVQQYQGDRYVKSYTTWQQYITILFSQVKQKDSIRDIITGLGKPMSPAGTIWGSLAFIGARSRMPTTTVVFRYLRICSIIFSLAART